MLRNTWNIQYNKAILTNQSVDPHGQTELDQRSSP